ncbi:MAG: SUMF1/EgtB/PvdO family nonheme iron enzyme [Bacteroidaceae bacterium]
MRKVLLSFVVALYAIVCFAQKQDVNEDGVVNSSDVVEIYNYICNGGNSGGGEDDASSHTITVSNLGTTVSFKMITVEGGVFFMGATFEQENPGADEMPAHKVTLSSFLIGETEVTQELWMIVTGCRPTTSSDYNWSDKYGKGNNYPAYNVSWNDCQDFIAKLNDLTGKKFRLPTEAEWEYAARGGKKSKGYQYCGSNTIDDVAWYDDNSGDKTHPVKTKQPNELGIYDMSGNAWEWCQDWYSSDYYSVNDANNPQGPVSGSRRILRGGVWFHDAWYCRTSSRNSWAPTDRCPGSGKGCFGLRIVLSE